MHEHVGAPHGAHGVRQEWLRDGQGTKGLVGAALKKMTYVVDAVTMDCFERGYWYLRERFGLSDDYLANNEEAVAYVLRSSNVGSMLVLLFKIGVCFRIRFQPIRAHGVRPADAW